MRKANLIEMKEFRNDGQTTCLVGRITHRDDAGRVSVDFAGNTFGPISARCSLSEPLNDLGAIPPVLLMFENGDLALPIIVGLVRDTLPVLHDLSKAPDETHAPLEVRIDRKTVSLVAAEQIEMRCGKSSVLLTKDGKIVLKGTEIVSRASGTNKIKGAAVKIN